eukprot:857774-Ditylum_brightwellii.AAC.1
MRDNKKNKKASQKQDNGSSVIGTQSLSSRLADREPSPVPKTGNMKASVGPQAQEKKAAKKDSQIKATAIPQATENKDRKEEAQHKATAGTQAVENKVAKDSVGPQGQVEASADIILEKDKGSC